MLAKEQVYVAKNRRKRAKKLFLCVLLWTEAESDGEKHSVFFTTHLPEPANMPPLSNNNPIVVYGNRQLGRCSGLGRTVGGGACK